MRSSIIILSFFALGIILALSGLLPRWMLNESLSTYALYLLMLIVGISVGSDKSMSEIFRRMKLVHLLVPVGVILGSLAGAVIVSLFIHQISHGTAMAIGAGFGYYSLSAILISGIRGDEAGVVALLANIFREVFTLVMAPFLVKLFGRFSIIASGGATAMDTTLPVIVRFSGKEMTVIAILSGIVLSLLVPVLVPFLLIFFS
ncbi:lysine exporter LysO family protein [Natronoflexus pectinivorans]|uniref:Lysine exporter LysO-like protein n=1 Tax=Natronoflexus pectinivorans TaxID=682526 RepID=A0A4R2GCC5_9BACT|nr:lysine exporter LysO family protein [Natronoflexus pectinivorans]TCO05392.1 lysine exporter LysO-like protein [Natronoflexus pectinivorans]